MTSPEPVKRTEEIESWSNLYLVHPLSGALVPVFARLGITPNQVSLAGLACGVLAGASYARADHPAFAALGFALMFAWHVLDGADGQLARLTNSFSELGKLIDGVCDYVTFTAVYLGFAVLLMPRAGHWVLGLIILAGVAHALQSAAFEMQRQAYNALGLGRRSAALPDLGIAAKPGLAGGLYRLYERVQILVSGGVASFAPSFTAALATSPDPDTLRARFRATFAPIVRQWSLFSSNTRTGLIFLCAITGWPLLYFALELLGLSAALAWYLTRQRALYESFKF
ncbi:CDP-alcohol phosphatidyltransferase family protein [Acidocella sp.]|uniref:CDP-alcohol phosphatidyltransferase family protein n=1 Tax=Acidocella sp. TaxID=50710 RepID=UPI00262692EF|nr:CDP-alcohol phosphatidyltransferase family protein [Acidocella sp.]